MITSAAHRFTPSIGARTAMAVFLVLGLSGCLKPSDQLLCAADEDCAADRRCEVVSGLCVPTLEPPTSETGGISGAFDCLLPSVGGPRASKVPGLASVVLRPPDADVACSGAPPGQILGLEVGCSVKRETQPRVRSGGEDPPFWVITFDQIAGDPSGPESRLRLFARVAAAKEGELTAPTEVVAQYYERCSHNDDSELRLRFVSTQGSLTLTSLTEDRVQGNFNLGLAGLSEGGDFGQVCDLPRSCTGGDCALIEQTTRFCRSGACFPDPRELDPSTGFCSGRCENHRDCGYDRVENPGAFCLLLAGRPSGQCIQLCDPAAAECPTGGSCRPGTDFDEFPGGSGPPRCLDECLATDSTPAAAEGCDSTPRPDAGVAPDAGPRPDAGRPLDGGMPLDGGPRDTGPADTGVLPDAGATSPLGASCNTNTPCPTDWFCAQASAGALGTEGYCTRRCMQSAQCKADYGGPGDAVCTPAVRNLQTTMVVNPACLIYCGSDTGQNGQCPGVMTCGDIVDNMTRMPPGDGAPDFCVE